MLYARVDLYCLSEQLRIHAHIETGSLSVNSDILHSWTGDY